MLNVQIINYPYSVNNCRHGCTRNYLPVLFMLFNSHYQPGVKNKHTQVCKKIYRKSFNTRQGVCFCRKVLKKESIKDRRRIESGVYLLAYNRCSLASHKLISNWNLCYQQSARSPALTGATTSTRQFGHPMSARSWY